jgi:sigma-54 specific flagellar transcriptional regulator A
MTSHWTHNIGPAQIVPMPQSAADDFLVGQTAPMLRLKRLLAAVAPSDAPVLIMGPVGAGKDRVAQALHQMSQRKGALVCVDCAALNEATLDTDLFGHGTTAGLIETAMDGTLFLDNVTALSDAAQTRLARVLDTRSLRRTGSNQSITVNFRLVSATCADLASLGLRSDFFHRIATFPLTVPALSARLQDLPALVADILAELGRSHPALDAPHFDASAIQALAAHSWTGNLRELHNIVLRAFLMFSGQTITARDLREALLMSAPAPLQTADDTAIAQAQHTCESLPEGGDMDLRCYLRDIEVGLIETALERSNGSVSKAADTLRLGRTTLIEKMRKYGIERDIPAAA